MKTQNYRSPRAFSLIELLVALSILAVVTALIVPRFLNVREQAAETTAKAQIKSLNNIYNQWIALGGDPKTSTASQIIEFLHNVPTSSSDDRSNSSSGACTDTLGDFGSTSIMLAGVTVDSATEIGSVAATDGDGFYGATSNLKVGNYYWPLNYDSTSTTPFSLGAKSSFSK